MNSSRLKAPPDLSLWIVKLSDYYCDGGGYGDVWKCLYNRESVSKEVAVKALRFQFIPATEESDSDDQYVRLARRELGIWRRLNHKNIVPFLGIAYGFGPHVALVSLWMPHGTLRAFLAARDDELTEYHKLQLLLDVADGLLYLHSQPFVHGDLTSNNVLIDESYCARIADFGLASFVGEIPEGVTYLHASTMRTGTVRWAAPEYFSQAADKAFQRTTKTDIYSFGHIIFQASKVLSGKEPWSEVREDFRVVLCLSLGQRPTRPSFPPIDNRHWDLIESCWRLANDRPTANDVVLMLRSLLASCSTKVPLLDLLRSPRVARQDIMPPNQESSAKHVMDNPKFSEANPKNLRTLSRSHPTKSLVGNRVAELESDLFKNSQSKVMPLFTHSLPSPSQPITEKTEGPADLDIGHPKLVPFADGTHIHVVKQDDQKVVAMNDIVETPEAVEPSWRPQTSWAAVKPIFVLPDPPSTTTPFISPAAHGLTATIVDPTFSTTSGSVAGTRHNAFVRTTRGPANGPGQRWWFAEGPDYGPVLEPFLTKAVGASVTVNPLLTPPTAAHQDCLRWNMLLPTSSCYRPSESSQSRMKERKEPAVHPRVTHIQLLSRSFPWMIHVRAQNPKLGVTCEEVLDAVERFMHDRPSKEDYESMTTSRKREVWANYTSNRSSDGTVPARRLGEGLKRIDWLGPATRFGGLVMDDGFVKERCGDVLPCTFELKCIL